MSLPVDEVGSTLIQFSSVTVPGEGKEFLWVFGGNIVSENGLSEPSATSLDAFKYESDTG